MRALFLAVVCVALLVAAEVEKPPVVYVPYDKVPTVDPKGQGVFLPYEQFVKLWDAAHPLTPKDEAKPPTGAVLTGFTMTGAVRGDAVELQMEGSLTALEKSWSQVALPAAMALTDFTPEDKRVVLERCAQNLLIHLPQAGTWRFTAKLAAPLLRDASGRRQVVLALPAAGAGRLDLLLPDAEADITVVPVVAFTSTAAQGGKRLLAVLGGAKELSVSWQPPAAPVSGQALVLAESALVITAAERSLRYDDRIDFTVLRRSVDRLAVHLPPDTQVLAVEADGLRTWSRTGDRLDVIFHEAVQGQVKVQLRLERLLEAAKTGETRRVAVPLPAPEGVARSTGTLALATGEGVALAVESAVGLGQADPHELFGERANSVAAAFRFAAQPQPLSLALTRLEADQRVALDQLTRLGIDSDLVVVTAAVDVRKSGVFTLGLRIPAAWELVDVAGLATDDVRRGAAVDGWCPLDLALKGRFIGTGSLTLRFRAPASIPRTPGDTTMTLAVATMPGARLTRGSLTVAAPRSWALATRQRQGMAGADETRREPARAALLKELGDDEEAALAFAVFASDARLDLTASPRPRELIVRQEELLTVADGRLARVITWRGEVRYNAAAALTIIAPTALDKTLTFKGPNLAEHAAISRADGHTTWELRFSAPVLGPFIVSAEEVRELPALAAGTPATVEVEPIAVRDSTRYQTLVAVAREGSLEVSVSVAGCDTVPPADLPPGLVGAGVVAGFQGSKAPAPKLTLTRHDLVAMPDAAVVEASYHAVLGEDGRMRVRSDLQLATRGRPWLGLRLPDGAELLEAAVDGHQARASRRTDGSVVIPLATAGSGLRRQRVSFVYEMPGRSGILGSFGSATLRIPVLGTAEEIKEAGRGAGEVKPLPVAGSRLALYVPASHTAWNWQGDFARQRHSDQTPPADDLTVRVSLVGQRYDLMRLGDGGEVRFRYTTNGLIKASAIALGLLGLAAIWLLRRRPSPLGSLLVLILALTLFTAEGVWSQATRGLLYGAVAGLLLVITTALIAWWRARNAAWVRPDPWLEKANEKSDKIETVEKKTETTP